jgi:hypothetical protein
MTTDLSLFKIVEYSMISALLGLAFAVTLFIRALRQRRLRGQTASEAFVSGQPPNVFSHGFVLPAIDDPRWTKAEGVDVFQLGAFRVERRFLTRDRKVMPLGRFSDACNWVVFMGAEPLPLRTGELNRYGDELVSHFQEAEREALLSRVQSEVMKDDINSPGKTTSGSEEDLLAEYFKR